MIRAELSTISLILSAHTPTESHDHLLELAQELTRASRLSLYGLNLATGEYDLLSTNNDTAPTPRIPAFLRKIDNQHEMSDILTIAARTRAVQRWSKKNASMPSRFHSPESASRIVYPLIRSRTAIGLLDVQSNDLDGSLDNGYLKLLTTILGEIMDRESSVKLLTEIQKPLDLTATRSHYFNSLAELVKLSTDYRFIAIREIEGEILRCVAQTGFTDRSLSSLDLLPEAIVAPFAEALHSQSTAWRASIDDADLGPLKTMGVLRDVQGFIVTPLYVGNETTGVLSAATSCYFEPSDQRVQSFRALGNAVALAIENFKNFHSTTGEIQELVSAAHSALSTVIMQSTRHSAVAHLGQAQTKLARAIGRVRDDQATVTLLRDASSAVEKGMEALNLQKHRSIVDPKTRNPEEIRLDQLIADVKSLVDGQLTAGSISWRSQAGGTTIYVIPDILPIALLQLVENSVEAFQSPGARAQGRQIRWDAEQIDGGRRVRLTYSDNATGISKHRLRIPASVLDSEHDEADWTRLIFEPGVTSKDEGTGWGLYYVRLLIDRAAAGQPNGIELADWKDGVTFRIELPSRPN